MDNEKKILSDGELENVTGGSFYDNGGSWSSNKPHELIVTYLNSCKGYEPDDDGVLYGCSGCKYSHFEFPVLYCSRRTYDNDPYA